MSTKATNNVRNEPQLASDEEDIPCRRPPPQQYLRKLADQGRAHRRTKTFKSPEMGQCANPKAQDSESINGPPRLVAERQLHDCSQLSRSVAGWRGVKCVDLFTPISFVPTCLALIARCELSCAHTFRIEYDEAIMVSLIRQYI